MRRSEGERIGSRTAERARRARDCDLRALSLGSHGVRQVVLLGHEGCGYYKARLPYESAEAMRRRQLHDLEAAARWVRGSHEGLAVAAYFAVPEGGRVRFEEV